MQHSWLITTALVVSPLAAAAQNIFLGLAVVVLGVDVRRHKTTWVEKLPAMPRPWRVSLLAFAGYILCAIAAAYFNPANTRFNTMEYLAGFAPLILLPALVLGSASEHID